MEGLKRMKIYDQLTELFNRFNQDLFVEILGDAVPECIITLHRKANTTSEMIFEGFIETENNEKMSEIILNPQWFGIKPRIEILQYLVHQMMHVYQHTYGEVTKSGRHDEQFQDFMNAIGLMPSDTGTPDGKPTGGKKLTNYPLPDGAFLQVCNEIAKENKLITWFEVDKPKNTSINDIVSDLYKKQELLDSDIHPALLEVPLLVSQNIDVVSLMQCLTVDKEINKVVVDENKAQALAEKAIKQNREERKLEDGFKRMDDGTEDDHSLSHYSKDDALELPDHFDDDLNEGLDIGNGLPIDDVGEDHEGLGKPKSIYRGDFGETIEDTLLKQAIANKPEKFEFTAHAGAKPSTIVKSVHEIAGMLGVDSVDNQEKNSGTKKTKNFKYTCSCSKTFKADNHDLNVICGVCQLHFMCETIERETDVVHG